MRSPTVRDFKQAFTARMQKEGWTAEATESFWEALCGDVRTAISAENDAPTDYSNGHPVHNGVELCECRLNDPPCRYPNGDVIEDMNARRAEGELHKIAEGKCAPSEG